MSFLRSRHEQLADHLRDSIRRGQLPEPLPNTRDWAGQLGVSCAPLYAALHTLQREKLIAIEPRRGVRLRATNLVRPRSGMAKVVRFLYRGMDYPDFSSYSNWCGLLSQRLQTHGIQFNLERCSDARLRALSEKVGDDALRSELLFLGSLSANYQRRFWRAGRAALIVGYPARGVRLPFVTCDLEGAIRHAAHGLLRRGYSRVHLLINRVHVPAVQRQCDAFAATCSAWPHQPVRGEVVRIPLPPGAQIAWLCGFARRTKDRHGIVVVAPVSVAAVMTALLGHSVLIPQQTEITLIETVPSSVVVWPPPIRYQVSLEAFVNTLTRAAVHFFETGEVPKISKTLPIEQVRP